ncbi:MAG: hypothetical protein AAFZ05_00220 [Pseudomonadota bacterium]
MPPHVAQSSERRGRVILRVCREPDRPVLVAAVAVARAFGADVESIFVEDTDQLAFASLPFAKLVSPSGARTSAVGPRDIDRAYRSLKLRTLALLQQIATDEETPVRVTDVRDNPLRALTAACTSEGPWNVAVLGERVGRDGFAIAEEILLRVPDITGIVLLGRSASRSRGTMVLIVDQLDDVVPFLKTAQRLAERDEAPIAILPAGSSLARCRELDGEIRLVISAEPHAFDRVTLVDTCATHGSPAAFARLAERLGPAMVIARHGGAILSDADAFAAFVRPLPCPVLVTR